MASDGDIKFPYVSRIKWSSVLTHNSKSGGTSHLRRHADICNAKLASTSTPAIGIFLKPTGVPASVKSQYDHLKQFLVMALSH